MPTPLAALVLGQPPRASKEPPMNERARPELVNPAVKKSLEDSPFFMPF